MSEDKRCDCGSCIVICNAVDATIQYSKIILHQINFLAQFEGNYYGTNFKRLILKTKNRQKTRNTNRIRFN